MCRVAISIAAVHTIQGVQSLPPTEYNPKAETRICRESEMNSCSFEKLRIPRLLSGISQSRNLIASKRLSYLGPRRPLVGGFAPFRFTH